MPRCSIQKVKLVAEAELPILPFLAPRVFQPWPFPRRVLQAHSTAAGAGKRQTVDIDFTKRVSSTKVRPDLNCKAVKHQASYFSTHSDTRDRSRSDHQHRRKDASKVQNSRSQVAQDWYENALSGLEEKLVNKLDPPKHKRKEKSVQAEDKAKATQEVASGTRAQRLALARQLEGNTEHIRKRAERKAVRVQEQHAIFTDKARWTSFKTRSPSLRTKWVQVGHAVRRRKPGAEGADSSATPAAEDATVPYDTELRYVIPEYALKWNQAFALLVNNRDAKHQSSSNAKRRIRYDMRAKQWAAHLADREGIMLTVNDLVAYVEQEAQPVLGWNDIWLNTMLYVLDQRSDDALRILTTIWHTSELPNPPLPWLIDALQYLVSDLSRWEAKDSREVSLSGRKIISLLCDVLEKPDSPRASISGSVIRPLLRRSNQDDCMRLFEAVKNNVSHVHWNTWLHFATSLARFDRFDQSLDALLEAASAGADTRSSQFESNCATILRKASDQPDGLRVSLRMVQNMSDIGVKLNLQLCNSVMLNAVEAGDLKTAFSIYHSLVEHGLEADKYTHAILLKGCKSIIEDSETLNTTIRQAISDTEISRSDVVATEILHCLYLHHFELNPQTAFNTVADAFSQLFDTSALVEMRILPDRPQQSQRMQPTMPALYIMITAYLRRSTRQNRAYTISDTHQLYRHIRMLTEQNVHPWTDLAKTDHLSNAFLLFFTAHASALSHAAEVVRDMQTSPVDPSGTPTTICKPTIRTWSIFLQGFAKHGKMDLAEQVLKYMREKNITPNQVTWNSLIGGYATARDVEGAVAAFQRMRGEGSAGNEVTAKALARIRDSEGAVARISRLGVEGGEARRDGSRENDDGFWESEVDGRDAEAGEGGGALDEDMAALRV